MNKQGKIIAFSVLTGLLIGFFASSTYSVDSKSYCERTEGAIKSQSNMTGAIACFEPGVVDVNLTEEVEQGANLKCVCRRSYQGNVQIWAINKAS